MVKNQINSRSRPCWTMKDGKLVAERSVTNLGRKIGVLPQTIESARQKNQGHESFEICGYVVHMGLHPSLSPEKQADEKRREAGDPLIWRPITHGLGHRETWS